MREARPRQLHAVPDPVGDTGYRNYMSAELRITLPGQEGSADARRAVAIVDKLLGVLDELDRVHGRGDGGGTTWALNQLELGSVAVGLVVGEPRDGVTVAEANNDLRLALEGFEQAEDHEGVPEGWTTGAARAGADLAKLLGATKPLGMVLSLVEDGQPPRRVAITRQAADHLTAPLRLRQETIGSLIGELDGFTSHGTCHEARLWLEHPNVVVKVYFREDQFEQEIRPKLKKRVMVAGRIERDGNGTPISIRMRPPIEVLPSLAEAPPLTSFAGAAPDLTGGTDPAEYVRQIRDAQNPCGTTKRRRTPV